MIHLAGWSEDFDSASLVNLAALADDALTVLNDDLQIPELNRILAVYALGPSVTRVALVAPSFNNGLQPEVAPIDVSAEPTSPTPWQDFRQHPMDMVVGERMRAQAAEDGATTRATVLIWLSDGIQAVPNGPVKSVRFTATITAVASAWTAGAITLTEELPVGSYAVVGMRCEGATLQAARLIFTGLNWRPGCIGYDAVGDAELPAFRYGGFGEWGRFIYNQQPRLEVLAVTTDSAQTGWLDLVKVG